MFFAVQTAHTFAGLGQTEFGTESNRIRQVPEDAPTTETRPVSVPPDAEYGFSLWGEAVFFLRFDENCAILNLSNWAICREIGGR